MFLDGLTTHVLGPIDGAVSIDKKARTIELVYFDAAGNQHFLVMTPSEADELASVLTAAVHRLSATREPK